MILEKHTMPDKFTLTMFHKKPNPQKNFFENYISHAIFIIGHLDQDYHFSDIGCSMREFSNNLNTSCQNLWNIKHLLIFDPLRDGYDYTDEILGATAVSALFLLVSQLSIGMALAQLCGGKDKTKTSLNFLLTACNTLAISCISFIKSLISLVSRPIVTAISGWKPQNINRFYTNNSLEEKIGQKLDEELQHEFR